METKCVGDIYKMLVTILSISVTKTPYFSKIFILTSGTNIYNRDQISRHLQHVTTPLAKNVQNYGVTVKLLKLLRIGNLICSFDKTQRNSTNSTLRIFIRNDNIGCATVILNNLKDLQVCKQTCLGTFGESDISNW